MPGVASSNSAYDMRYEFRYCNIHLLKGSELWHSVKFHRENSEAHTTVEVCDIFTQKATKHGASCHVCTIGTTSACARYVVSHISEVDEPLPPTNELAVEGQMV